MAASVDVLQRLFHDGQPCEITEVLINLVVARVSVNPLTSRVFGWVTGDALFPFFLIYTDVINQVIGRKRCAEVRKPFAQVVSALRVLIWIVASCAANIFAVRAAVAEGWTWEPAPSLAYIGIENCVHGFIWYLTALKHTSRQVTFAEIETALFRRSPVMKRTLNVQGRRIYPELLDAIDDPDEVALWALLPLEPKCSLPVPKATRLVRHCGDTIGCLPESFCVQH